MSFLCASILSCIMYMSFLHVCTYSCMCASSMRVHALPPCVYMYMRFLHACTCTCASSMRVHVHALPPCARVQYMYMSFLHVCTCTCMYKSFLRVIVSVHVSFLRTSTCILLSFPCADSDMEPRSHSIEWHNNSKVLNACAA